MNDGDTDRRVVDGRFELETRLGGGGMGTVWRARDLLLHRSVAVKEVRPAGPDLAEYDPDSARMLRERVLREGRALARVQHPNVVTIHHIVDGGEGTYPWIVMELVEGGSLADRLARAPMTPAEAARLGRGVLDALRAAHTAGVQHRDVKPANVLLRSDGRPVLTDFGIAAIRDSTALTATGSVIGTADYMAPERVTGGDGGPAADLWSLAMMLYVAVEGHHPLRRGTTLATLAAVLHEDVPPPKQAGPLTPVLERVLVRDPATRPDAGTVDGLLAAAAEAVDDSGPTSYPLAPPQPPPTPPSPDTVVPRPGRTRRALIASVAAGTVLVGGATWLALSVGDKGDEASGAAGPSRSAPSRHTTRQQSPGATEPSGSPAPSGTSKLATGMLTPAAIRKALKVIDDETGRTTFGDFKIYPGYISLEAMVPGSRTRYDSYTYRPASGLEKGLFKSTLTGGDSPVSLKNFNWDVLPSLLALAEKKLHVDKPTLAYLWLEPPSKIFERPATIKVYLTNEYGETGYVEATPQGNVTKVNPADA
ncbi:serine/threonine-protein kinase [Streptomyces sp. NPDC001401]|uniref:serine/threonine-protein kinase n=1 Tax=Streptomyces sp. NPDC001401 TaxID=3364570 RepID=UPI0036B0B0F2